MALEAKTSAQMQELPFTSSFAASQKASDGAVVWGKPSVMRV